MARPPRKTLTLTQSRLLRLLAEWEGMSDKRKVIELLCEQHIYQHRERETQPMRIILLVGPIGAGKSTFARHLAEVEPKARVLSTSSILGLEHQKLYGKLEASRLYKQELADRLDADTDGAWVRDAIVPVLKAAGDHSTIIVDCVRRQNQIAAIRKAWPNKVIVIGIKTAALEEHLKTRNLSIEDMRALATAMQHPVERALPMHEADIIIDNTRMTSDAALKMVAR